MRNIIDPQYNVGDEVAVKIDGNVIVSSIKFITVHIESKKEKYILNGLKGYIFEVQDFLDYYEGKVSLFGDRIIEKPGFIVDIP